MCALEIRNINDLINIIIPKFNSFKITTINDIQKLNSKKSMSFKLWCYLVKIIYYGYHNIEEGLSLLNSIKENLNKLSTSETFKKVDLSSYEINFNGLFDHPSPYEGASAALLPFRDSASAIKTEYELYVELIN